MAECQQAAYRLDAESFVTRRRRAEADRHVSLRPAPDCMTWLTALLPVKEGVAAYAALTRTAASARASGDPRSKGQVMADELVEAVGSRLGSTTGQGSSTTGQVSSTTGQAARPPARAARPPAAESTSTS